jgi:hypothetical protein
MAMLDWNNNGKNDAMDDFIEYEMLYKDGDDSDQSPRISHSRDNGISTFGAIISIIGGLILQALIYTLLGIDVEAVPVFVIIIMWAIGSTVISFWVKKMES